MAFIENRFLAKISLYSGRHNFHAASLLSLEQNVARFQKSVQGPYNIAWIKSKFQVSSAKAFSFPNPGGGGAGSCSYLTLRP